MRLFFLVLALLSAGAISACQSAGASADEPVGLASFTGTAPTRATTTVGPAPATEPVASTTPEPASLLAAAPSSTPTQNPSPPACLAAGGRIEYHSLQTDLALLPWEFRVYLPPCYDEAADRHYPLLILIHGQTYTDDQWDRLGADETADRLITGGEIPPLIILMPRDRRWVDPPKDRFGEALTELLIPWVDENYRTVPERDYRAIGGLSRGASWAVHLGLSRWELFGALGAHSLPVFWSDTPKVRRFLNAIPPGSLPRIFVDIGEGDYLIESAVWFEGVLHDLDIPHEWRLFTGEHEEAYWMRHLEDYLRWYTAEW